MFAGSDPPGYPPHVWIYRTHSVNVAVSESSGRLAHFLHLCQYSIYIICTVNFRYNEALASRDLYFTSLYGESFVLIMLRVDQDTTFDLFRLGYNL